MRVDHLNVRYHDVSPREVVDLEDALHALVTDGLASAVAAVDLEDGLLDGRLAGCWAVCLAEVYVEVSLDPGRRSECVRAWAEALVGAVREAVVEGTSRPAEVAGLVVYRTEGEALVDLLTAVASGETTRAWAWRQIGLIRPTVGVVLSDVVDALVARPRSVPAVLGAVDEQVLRVLAPMALRRLARAVLRAVDGHAPAERSGPAEAVTAGPATGHRLIPAAVAALPTAAWAGATDPLDQAALGVLSTAMVAPAHLHDSRFVEGVVADALRPVRSSVTRRPDDRGSTLAHHRDDSTDDHREDHRDEHRDEQRDEGELVSPVAAEGTEAPRASQQPEALPALVAGPEADAGADADGVVSDWGGVWFLLHAFDALDVVDAWVHRGVAVESGLRQVIVSLTGAPTDDPCVAWLSGDGAGDQNRGQGAETDAVALDAQVDPVVADVKTWLLCRAEGRLTDLALAAAWRRPVVLRALPGELEVEFRLADVDLDVRVAGLDLDPGWVWWLGSFVRFRYV